jgi:DNA-nicking Smr family endonuclease
MRKKKMTPEEEEAWQEVEQRIRTTEQETVLRQHAYNRACEVMRELNIAELSQMTMLRVFALGYRAAVLDEQRKKNGN